MRRAPSALAVAVLAVSLGMAGCGDGRTDDAATTFGSVTPTGGGPPDPDVGVDKYALGAGRHTIDSDPGWVYFRTPAGRGCAIGPIGQVVACDFAPADAPPGSNQTIVEGGGPAIYRRVAAPEFTRNVDVLPVRHRLTNGATRCAVDPRGAVRCETLSGAHGFVIDASTGTLW